MNIELSAVETWSKNAKLLVRVCVGLIVLIMGFYFDVSPQWYQWEKLEEKEQELKLTFERRQKKVVNFISYKNQYSEVEKQLVNMLNKLPTKSEVAVYVVKTFWTISCLI